MKKKKKQKPVINPFEQVGEMVRETASTTVKETVKALNPLDALFSSPTQAERKRGNNNFTDLDLKKLQEQHAGTDEHDIEAIRAQLNPEQKETREEAEMKMQYHKRIQREEEEVTLEKEQEAEEKKRQEAIEAQEKQQMEETTRKQQQAQAPKGKVKKSILGGKGNMKASTELPPELKPGAGRG